MPLMRRLQPPTIIALAIATPIAVLPTVRSSARAADGISPCAICHANVRLALERGAHGAAELTCVLCHGDSTRHIVVEDNSVRPDRPLSDAKDAVALCTQCHLALPAHCEEPPAIDQQQRVPRVAGQPVPSAAPAPAPCARCHDPHRAHFWASETAGKGHREMSETFQAGHARKWSTREGDDWAIVEEDGQRAFSLRSLGTHGEKPRRPVSFALWKGGNFSDFVLTGRVRCTDEVSRRGRSLIIVFNYIDYKHFYYVHLCNISNDVHNNLLIVDEEDRKPLLPGGNAEPTLLDDEWHDVKVVRRASDGLIEVYFGDMDTPLHRAFDKTHSRGLIGIGTFHSKGDFDDLQVEGELIAAPTSTQ